jgi:hypothetical protein
MKGLPSAANSPQVKVVQWNEGHATEEFKPRMVYLSLFPEQSAKALFTLIPCIIFKSTNFAFLAADVDQANKITIQSHHKHEKYPGSNKSRTIGH